MFKAFGSFGSKIWESIKSAASPLTEALGLGRQAGIEVSPADVQREYRKVVRLEGISEQLATLDFDQYVPGQLWQEAPIPWKRPFTYQVTISGRDLLTGRFAREQRVITSSDQLTVAEVMDEAETRFGKVGTDPQFDITHLSVTAAWLRPGEVF